MITRCTTCSTCAEAARADTLFQAFGWLLDPMIKGLQAQGSGRAP